MPLYEESVELLAELVAFPTESETPNIDLVESMTARAAGAGAAARQVDGPAGRANLHLRFGPDAPGGVLVAGHTDVVPAGSGWTTDPYTLTRRADRLYGRGTADMKGFIACAMAAALSRGPARWHAPLHVCLSYDEEVGCAGVPGLLEVLAGDPLVEPDVVVVGEPTQLTLRTSHAGKVAYTVRTCCLPGHSSLAPSRTNAVSEMVAVASTVIGINARAARPGISTNVGTLRGGTAVNVLAAASEMAFECRHPASADPDEILAGVWAQIEQSRAGLAPLEGTVEVTCDSRYPALSTDAAHPAMTRLANVLGSDLAGHLPFGCEAGLYAQFLAAPAAVFGPGSIADAHRPDEFVTTDQITGACTAMTALIEAYCECAEDHAGRHAEHHTEHAQERSHERIH
ncbi:MAG: M20/M25/M40 family metallo-hydrolase [Acidimicrobiaceae bacterium]|nr:M20/M25/M40 family metallo-hydrolase [Acidimicrobiaceae bacterium]